MVADLEHELSNTYQALKTCVSTPIVPGYQLEVGAMPELGSESSLFPWSHWLVVLWWIIELGQMDILVHVLTEKYP